jgi:pyruvate kinase
VSDGRDFEEPSDQTTLPHQVVSGERRTKIVATLGPASASPEALRTLLAAGVDVVRLNLSHGSVEEHLGRLAMVRKTADSLGRVVAVLADLPGPKVRAGAFLSDGVLLAEGSTVAFVAGNSASTAERVEVDYPTLLDDLAAGDRVVVGDGAISARITEVSATAAMATIITGGRVAGRPGIHLPSTRLRLTTPTPLDLILAVKMAEAGVDFLAVSFVREGKDMLQVRNAVKHLERPPRLVAKIETAQAMENLRGILNQSDAVMVARGDLGIDCDLADVPHIQKRLIRTCVEEGIPVITATQMLETMITAPTPTRAEVSDVANAVFDGTDAVMLSAETAVGHDPALVVRTMSEICMRAEAQASYRQWATRLGRMQRSGKITDRSARITAALTHAAWQAAEDASAEAIVCCTRSGATARAMARFRPLARLIAASPSIESVRVLALSWGVTPIQINEQRTADDMIWVAVERATELGLVSVGELVIALAGTKSEVGAPIDLARVIEIH